MRTHVLRLGVIGVFLGSACAGTTEGGLGSPDGGGTGGEDGGGQGHKDAGLTLDSSSPKLDGTAACMGMRCSSDLHSLVDWNGNVLKTCPPNEGCSGTSCVPACQSAQDNKSSLGCDYYAVDPDILAGIGGGAGGCFVAYVANTWDSPVTLTVDYAGMSLDPSKFAYIPSGSGM